jgi:hypothetical protein
MVNNAGTGAPAVDQVPSEEARRGLRRALRDRADETHDAVSRTRAPGLVMT